MGERKLKTRLVILFTVVLIFIVLFTSTTSLFSVSGTSITMENHYPVDGETYESVNHFLEQTTAVNTDTAVSISIDGEPIIPMIYQGIRNEIVPGDSVARDWHTWNLTIPVITEPGKHTFQFFRHYYVWQKADKYLEEFNATSPVYSFNISESSATPSPSPSPEAINPIYTLTPITASGIAAFLVLVTFTLRKQNQKRSRADGM